MTVTSAFLNVYDILVNVTANQNCLAVFLRPFLLICWATLVSSTVLTKFFPTLEQWSNYGKLSASDASSGLGEKKTTRRVYYYYMDKLQVPKRLFVTFYLIGLTVMVVIKAFHVRVLKSLQCNNNSPIFLEEKGENLLLSCIVLSYVIHLGRRFYEEYTSPPSSAKMHLLGYLIGASFYVLSPLTLYYTINSNEERDEKKKPPEFLFFIVALVGLFWASYRQHACHLVLIGLKKKGAYAIPTGDWFNVVSNPHYWFEILIYAFFLVLLFATNQKLDLQVFTLQIVFVVLNLCVTGSKTHDWYHEKFDNYPKERFRVIPYVF